jgi:hypothetical protein
MFESRPLKFYLVRNSTLVSSSLACKHYIDVKVTKTAAKALAYYDTANVIAVKSFIGLAPWRFLTLSEAIKSR